MESHFDKLRIRQLEEIQEALEQLAPVPLSSEDLRLFLVGDFNFRVENCKSIDEKVQGRNPMPKDRYAAER